MGYLPCTGQLDGSSSKVVARVRSGNEGFDLPYYFIEMSPP